MVQDINGLKVKYGKSHITGINIEESGIRHATSIIGCQIESFLFTYMGFSLSPRSLHCKDWQAVIQRFESRLVGWKARLHSYEGRMVLCKSMLDNLPIYFLFILRILKMVAKKLKSIQANFF